MIRRSVILIRGTVSRTEKRVSSKRKRSFNSKANFIQNTLDKARWASRKSMTVNSWEKFDLSDSLPARSNCGTELWKESLRGMTDWKCITIAGRKGRNHVLAVCSGLMKSDRWSTSISIVSLKLLKVELVRVVLASNLGQHFLVVVITQCPTKLLVGHVSSAIPVSQRCAACSGRMIVNCPFIPSQDIIEENQGLDNMLRMNSSSWDRVFNILSTNPLK